MTFEICLHLWRIEVWYFLSFCSVSFEETCEYFPVLFVGFASPEDDHTEPNVRSQKRTLHKILFCWSGWWLPVNDVMRAVSRKYRSYLRWSVLFRGILSTSFRFFSEVTELNTFILKGLKLPGVHVHPFPLLFGNTQRGVQPKLGALRLAPLEILRAKLSNQAAIQQGPAPLPVNHRLSSSSGNRDTVWKIHWWMTREEFMLKWTEKRFLLSEKRVSEDLSRSGYVQATKSLRRCKESSCRKIIRVCWDERRKNNVQPTDSSFFFSLKTDGALLLLRLKPFFVSLLYIFCPSSTNSLMRAGNLTGNLFMSGSAGRRAARRRASGRRVLLSRNEFFNLSHTTMAAWNICFISIYSMLSFSLWIESDQSCDVEGNWLTDTVRNIRDEDVSVSGTRWMFDEDRDDVNLMLGCRRPRAGRPVTCVIAAGCTAHVS